ncbi:RHS repeat domain-containing protein [Pseudomonas sp. NFIX28]|uniref:RHS repeat domain-containing protein n=1 Tax=Pseudomonas sp. NFIX28 TaxID=1566235 RepID=UPI0008964F0A|nr:RHS repeat-associated core domain-containing protein [Pseudomonas sp. NFIX28]SDZ68378.1 insecticidal toxin complex protein TccC [Pseudomonas sp. NFIX28]
MTTTTIADAATAQRCCDTPTLSVFDNRGLQVRTVRYNRTKADEAPDELITRQTWSARGDQASTIDARLFDEQRKNPAIPPNFRYICSVSGQPLAILSQDAGEHLSLPDAEGGLIWQRDERDQQRRCTYDLLHRLTSVTGQTADGAKLVSERLIYGDAAASIGANLRGQLWQHYSPAGLSLTPAYGLTGQLLSTQQRFLLDDVLDSDWQGDDPAAWAHDLAPDAYTTRWTYDALGQELGRTDARGNQQRQCFNLAHQLIGSDVKLAGQAAWKPLLCAITYSAAGQVLREEFGNGVITDYSYEPQTQRLAELRSTRSARNGRPSVLRALSYEYDPIGNLLAIDDAAEAIRYTRNQRIDPVHRYTYDALSQLTQVMGRENANAGRQSQALPAAIMPLFQDTSELTNYSRTYTYDRGGNLTAMHHQGTTSYALQMAVARGSNRAVPQTDGLTLDDVNGYFDACGNLKELSPGQQLIWDGRNQLRSVTQIVRSGAANDTEVYWYDGTGLRTTKLSSAQTSGTTRIERVRYLPGLEIRQTEQRLAGGDPLVLVEDLNVLTLGATGRQSIRLLHWAQGKPASIENDQLRCSLDDQIGSSMIELDAQADIVAREEYFPYGGTAVWSARSDTEAKYKYIRYSGQERDATGLYYYGLRYYAPWVTRWINPDPAGPIDGLNLFCMVANNPVTRRDIGGLAGSEEEIPLLQLQTHDSGRSMRSAYGSREGRYMRFDNPVYADTTEPIEVRSSGPSTVSRLTDALRQRMASVRESFARRPRERAYETIPLLNLEPEASSGPIFMIDRATSGGPGRLRPSGYQRLGPSSEPRSSRAAREAVRQLNPQPMLSGHDEEIELTTLSPATRSWEETISRSRQIVGGEALNQADFALDISGINVELREQETLDIATALYQLTAQSSTSSSSPESELETTPLLGTRRTTGGAASSTASGMLSFFAFAWWSTAFFVFAFAFSFFGFSWATRSRRAQVGAREWA